MPKLEKQAKQASEYINAPKIYELIYDDNFNTFQYYFVQSIRYATATIRANNESAKTSLIVQRVVKTSPFGPYITVNKKKYFLIERAEMENF